MCCDRTLLLSYHRILINQKKKIILIAYAHFIHFAILLDLLLELTSSNMQGIQSLHLYSCCCTILVKFQLLTEVLQDSKSHWEDISR